MSGFAASFAKSVLRLTGREGDAAVRLRNTRNRLRYATGRPVSSTHSYVAKGSEPGHVGLYGYAGCDVWAIAAAGRQISRMTDKTLAINAFGRAAFTRSDLILQTLEGVDEEHTREVVEKFQLEPAMFQPILFEPRFVVPEAAHLGGFPKSVVVISISSDLVRTLYRHREHGFLVDPGGFWLASGIENALEDLEHVRWFSKTFQKVGRISLEESIDNLRILIPLIREKTGAAVVVFNTLTVDPSRYQLDYDQSHSPHRTRRRDFVAALVDVSRELDFSIVDVDRAIKAVGMEGMIDFVKFGPIQRRAVADSFVQVLNGRGLI